jgi:roadblock/LC7 domain-containing protein
MSFTADDLAQVNAAIASGELTVSVQGRTVTYRSIDDLFKAKAAIEADLAAQAAGSGRRARTGHFTFAMARERY